MVKKCTAAADMAEAADVARAAVASEGVHERERTIDIKVRTGLGGNSRTYTLAGPVI